MRSRICFIAGSCHPSPSDCRAFEDGERLMNRYIGAIDQGTTSTRFILFDERGSIAALAQLEHAQIYPQPGWVEHDAAEIWRNTQAVIEQVIASGIRAT